jgi:hypothetical protein
LRTGARVALEGYQPAVKGRQVLVLGGPPWMLLVLAWGADGRPGKVAGHTVGVLV